MRYSLVSASAGLAALFSMLLLPTASVAENTLDDIIEAGAIRIAVPQNYPPFGFAGTDGKLEGYDIDVAELLARDLGVRLELVPVSSVNRIPYLQASKVDLIISSLGASPERAKAIAFSQAYAPFYAGVYGSSEIKVASPAELSDKTIGVTRNTLEDLELTKVAPQDAAISRFDDPASLQAALLAGKIQLVAEGNAAMAALAVAQPGRTFERKFILRQSPAHIGVRRGDIELRHWVDVFIYHEMLGGNLNQLSLKWFGEPLPALPPL
jgi:polar amino acid transport system substrate-binding protein